MAEEQLGDRTVGVQKSEEILPVGTLLTAVGELRSVVGHPDAYRVRWPLLLAWQSTAQSQRSCSVDQHTALLSFMMHVAGHSQA